MKLLTICAIFATSVLAAGKASKDSSCKSGSSPNVGGGGEGGGSSEASE